MAHSCQKEEPSPGVEPRPLPDVMAAPRQYDRPPKRVGTSTAGRFRAAKDAVWESRDVLCRHPGPSRALRFVRPAVDLEDLARGAHVLEVAPPDECHPAPAGAACVFCNGGASDPGSGSEKKRMPPGSDVASARIQVPRCARCRAGHARREAIGFALGAAVPPSSGFPAAGTASTARISGSAGCSFTMGFHGVLEMVVFHAVSAPIGALGRPSKVSPEPTKHAWKEVEEAVARGYEVDRSWQSMSGPDRCVSPPGGGRLPRASWRGRRGSSRPRRASRRR